MVIPGYRIVKQLGQGGMSVVYLAIQESVDREIALKVMSPALSSDPSFGERFFREANIVGRLSHPNIIAVYDVGRHEQYHYIAMDYLPGEPLSEKIKEGLEDEEIVRIATEMGAALDYAHQHGFIHRDVKPENVLFRKNGSAVLTDFGIAKAVNTASEVTQHGTVIGTPHYMSPEQTQGAELGPPSDFYSLGVVLYQMLTKELPFRGEESIAVAIQHLTAPIPRLPLERRRFQPIIDRLLAKKPNRRYRNGKDLSLSLNSVGAGGSGGSTGHLSTRDLMFALMNSLSNHTWALMSVIRHRFQWLDRLHFSWQRGLIWKLDSTVEEVSNHSEMDTMVSTASHDDYWKNAVERGYAKLLMTSPGVVCCIILMLTVFWSQSRLNSIETVLDVEISAFELEQPLTLPPPPPVIEETQTVAASSEPDSQTELEPEPEPKPTPARTRVEPKPAPVIPALPDGYFRLAINTEPRDASVRVLNIGPKYQRGMPLPAGPYHIEVSHPDHYRLRTWLSLSKDSGTPLISLTRMGKNISAGSQIVDFMPDGELGPIMLVIPAGSFIMGSNDKTNEKPPHEVTISKPFAMGQYEVSIAEAKRFVAAVGRERKFEEDDNHPVAGINWRQANAYTKWLSETTGQTYRLPTEAEWEYAARAGTTGKYWWEGDTASGQANCKSGCNSQWSALFSGSTAPIASFDRNPFGLYDVLGNVAEWTLDCATKNYNNAPTDGSAFGFNTCPMRITRGGSYRESSSGVVVSRRKARKVTYSSDSVGLRLVREIR